ncbi:divergent PAP2 family protein [Desulfuromonas acetexigens]|uniref:Divergent PAP2 family protein n=1 Tax=Trichloromonas acetexigens TaxID=38815 RepID=A0A550JHP9_9BACT|nr:divergent PAP2 family protein [Desulfuromonas acetexigens]TRO82713.1 divergent PAP2 family protein [Desulfuromonas acetexigens]
MDYSYVITPFFAWFIAGIFKFTINSVKARQFAFGLIGYGGLPSNHSAIVSSMAALIAFREGLTHPAFGVSLTLAFIVMLDANSLRREVGKHAVIINGLFSSESACPKLRERMGHTRLEILCGILVGVAVATFIHLF